MPSYTIGVWFCRFDTELNLHGLKYAFKIKAFYFSIQIFNNHCNDTFFLTNNMYSSK